MTRGSDVGRLKRFLDRLQADLRLIVGNGETFLPGYPQTSRPDHYRNLDAAWEDEGGSVEQAFEALKERLDDENRDLARHGLRGDPLRFKLGVVEDHREGFAIITDEEPLGDVESLVDAVRGKLLGPITGSYLDTAETVLDSLIDALGVGEAIKELKEMIRQMLPF